MNKRILNAAPLLAGIALLSGCSSTLSGAKQDASNDTQAVQQATGQVAQDAQKTADDAKAAARNAAEATILVPSVKTAIIADTVLRDPRNQIKVSTADNVVHLTGHVASADMKTRATEDAQTEITRRHATATVSNDLTVTGA